MGNSQPAKRRDPYLDLLRAIAILLVVGYHAKTGFIPGFLYEPIFSRGGIGVDIFFVLSGYLISDQWFATTKRGDASLGGFYLRRAFRILPAYWVMLLVHVLLVPDGLPARTDPSVLMRHISWSQLPMYLAFVQNYFVMLNRFGATWSLCVEEHFYLFFPLSALLILKKKPSWIVPLCAVFVLFSLPLTFALWEIYHPLDGLTYRIHFYMVTHVRAFGIGFGVLLGAIKNFRPGLWGSLLQRRVLTALAAVFGLAMYLLVISHHVNADLFHFQNPLYSPLAVVFGPFFLYLFLSFSLLTGVGLKLPDFISVPATFVAAMAFSLYLTHDLIFDWMRWKGVSDVWQLPAALAGACVLYYGVEKPFLDLRSSFASKRSSKVRPA